MCMFEIYCQVEIFNFCFFKEISCFFIGIDFEVIFEFLYLQGIDGNGSGFRVLIVLLKIF